MLERPLPCSAGMSSEWPVDALGLLPPGERSSPGALSLIFTPAPRRRGVCSFCFDARNVLNRSARPLDGHIEHVSNVLCPYSEFQAFPCYSASPRRTSLTRHVQRRAKNLHLDLYDSVTPYTPSPAAAFHVEAEPTLPIAPALASGSCAKRARIEIKHPGVGGGFERGVPADRRLIDRDHLVECADMPRRHHGQPGFPYARLQLLGEFAME